MILMHILHVATGKASATYYEAYITRKLSTSTLDDLPCGFGQILGDLVEIRRTPHFVIVVY